MILSPSNTVILRVEAAADTAVTAQIVAELTDLGTALRGMDVRRGDHDKVILDITCDTRSPEHQEEVVEGLEQIPEVKVLRVSDATFMAHKDGKIEVSLKAPIRNRADLSRVYTPGVARVCTEIAKNPARARDLTIKRNTVAVVTDGSAVLGLGNIGPTAALPVMEGKAALFKQFGGVDAWPVCLDTTDTEEIIRIVEAIAPVYGGINLEDIAAPRCFEVEARLREKLDIPVFHDDQHGTAIVVLAALINALQVVEKKLEDVRIVVSGVGAAGSAIIRLLLAQGARDIVGYGRTGAIHSGIETNDPSRRRLAENTNPRGVTGSLVDGLVGADVFIGVSKGNILTGADVATMTSGAIVFALANPTPEVDPLEAAATAAIVATGRSDYANQINNVLAFPGLFRGLLDVGAREISDEILRAAAVAIANVVPEDARTATYIIPGVFDPSVGEAVAVAVREQATLELSGGGNSVQV
ncbi:MAG TPA: NAD-dependent malic enzyme [Actinomycetaceae bacterium]|nr:NAD-dependent malic enzyme [Actinomycetaceae bacterium]